MDKGSTEVLEAEHRVILRVIGAMARMDATLERGADLKVETLLAIVEFMRTFADKCHHGKEEAHLFSTLQRKGVPIGGCPLGALIREHEQGRTLVRDLEAATEAYLQGGLGAREALAKSLRGLVALYPNHIWKEDYLLFPMTDKLLGPEEHRELQEKFDAVEAEVGRDVHQRFEQLAQWLEDYESRQ
ncbi:MAG TPA: hemerythrin domain-containing protein [Candidatus Methylomirabilis sp.]|nr:hemerythrin domain-containing protein [Candidatus Methylomirabilis sp.]